MWGCTQNRSLLRPSPGEDALLVSSSSTFNGLAIADGSGETDVPRTDFADEAAARVLDMVEPRFIHTYPVLCQTFPGNGGTATPGNFFL